MDIDKKTDIWIELHPLIERRIPPGPAVGDALDWCERYVSEHPDLHEAESKSIAKKAVGAWWDWRTRQSVKV